MESSYRVGAVRPDRPRGRAQTLAAVAVVIASLAITGLGLLALAPSHATSPRESAKLIPAAVSEPSPYSNDMPAALVIGQTSFLSSSSATTAKNLSGPDAAAFDSAGDLWVVDRGNNRVLEYVPPFSTGMAASVVLGQASFTTHTAATTATNLTNPSGVTAGPGGSVWVADSLNNRVLEFVPPFTSGMAATLVIGQSGFTTSTAATTAAGFDFPFAPRFTPGGDLLVTDYFHNRVLEFVPPFTDGMSATLVLGQATFTSGTAGTTSTNFSNPLGLALTAGGDLFVSDTGNNRVLEFTPPFSSGMAASLVLGQATFTTGTSGTSATALDDPTAMSVDSRGDLWVSDAVNDRQLEFIPPFSTDMAASIVLGQASFTTRIAATSQTGFSFDIGNAINAQGDLWVADQVNSRVMEFVPSQFPVQFVEAGLSYQTNWSVTLNGVAHASTSGVIGFSAENGTYAWSVSPVNNYAAAPMSGSVVVNGTNATVVVAFVSTSSAAGPSPLWPLLTIVLAIVVAIDTALVVMLLRRGTVRAPRPPPQPIQPGPPPAAGGAPPPPSG